MTEDTFVAKQCSPCSIFIILTYFPFISAKRVIMKTSKKPDLLPKNRARLKQDMVHDYDLYHFVHQRFYHIVTKLQRQNTSINTFPIKAHTHPCYTQSRELLEQLKKLGLNNRTCVNARQLRKAIFVKLGYL